MRIHAGTTRHESRLGTIWLDEQLGDAELDALVAAIERAGIVESFRSCDWLELDHDGHGWLIVDTHAAEYKP